MPPGPHCQESLSRSQSTTLYRSSHQQKPEHRAEPPGSRPCPVRSEAGLGDLLSPAPGQAQQATGDTRKQTVLTAQAARAWKKTKTHTRTRTHARAANILCHWAKAWEAAANGRWPRGLGAPSPVLWPQTCGQPGWDAPDPAGTRAGPWCPRRPLGCSDGWPRQELSPSGDAVGEVCRYGGWGHRGAGPATS